MKTSLADDPTKDIIIYINDFYPELPAALRELSDKLSRPLRGIMLVDAERKASGNYRVDKERVFEEIVVDFSDDGALRRAIKPLEDKLLLITCASEQSQLYFKRVIPHVPYVNTPTESSLTFCTDKGKMRELFISYDPDTSPEATVVNDASPASVEKVCAKLTFPLIIKPTNLSASRLVNKAVDKDDLRRVLKESFAYLEEIYPQQRGLGDKTMIAEEFVEGDLFSTDVYVDAVGKVYVLPLIHFQNGIMAGMDSYQVYQSETYHTLSADEERSGADTAVKAIHAVGLRSSVAHIELFHTTNGWKIVELGARPGGWRQEMYGVSYGIDHALNELLIKIGMEPDMPQALRMHSTTFKVHAPKVGKVTLISGAEEARKHPRMHSIHVNVSLGDVALPSTHGGGPLVDGLMYHKDHEQLNRELAAIRESIKVDIQHVEGDIV